MESRYRHEKKSSGDDEPLARLPRRAPRPRSPQNDDHHSLIDEISYRDDFRADEYQHPSPQISDTISNLTRSEVTAMVEAAEKSAFSHKIGKLSSPGSTSHQRVGHNNNHPTERANLSTGAGGLFTPQPPPQFQPALNSFRGSKYSPHPATNQQQEHRFNEISHSSKSSEKSPSASTSKAGLPKVYLPQKAVDELLAHYKSSNSKQKKPLYLRVIETAEREAKVNEKRRDDIINRKKESKKTGNPSKEEIRRHIEKHDKAFAPANYVSKNQERDDVITSTSKEKSNGTGTPTKRGVKSKYNKISSISESTLYESNSENDIMPSDVRRHVIPGLVPKKSSSYIRVQQEIEQKKQQKRQESDEVKLRVEKRKEFGRKVRDRALNKADMSPDRREEIESDFDTHVYQGSPSMKENRSPNYNSSSPADKSPQLRTHHRQANNNTGTRDHAESSSSRAANISFRDYEAQLRDKQIGSDRNQYMTDEISSRSHQHQPHNQHRDKKKLLIVDGEDDTERLSPREQRQLSLSKEALDKVTSPRTLLDLELTLLPHGSEWVSSILRYDQDENNLAEIYEQGFTIMMIENGLIDDEI